MGEQFFKVYKSDFDYLSQRYDLIKKSYEERKKRGEFVNSNDKPVNFLLELTLISFIRDRMKSSRTSNKFSNNNGLSYVIITHKEITKRFKCTGRSCTRVLKDLEACQLLRPEREKMQANKYYLNNSHSVGVEEMGYYKFYSRYFNEFDHKLNVIYAYIILKDFYEMARYTNGLSGCNFKDKEGKYFVGKNLQDICRLLKCSLPTGGKIINLLENNGYIHRKRRRHKISRIYLIK